MDKKKDWMLRLFLALFTLSVSVTVIPCGIVNVHGLFGEITSSIVTEDEARIVENTASRQMQKLRKAQGINIFNIWFELLTVVICICFMVYMIRLPRGDTIITLKVRMDN